MIFHHQKPENQTEFIEEAPFLADVEEADLSEQAKATKERRQKSFKNILFFAGASLIILALILALINTFYHPVQQKRNSKELLPSPTSSMVDHSLLGQLKTLKQSFLLHDPAEEALIFPNVSQSIYLDKPKVN